MNIWQSLFNRRITLSFTNVLFSSQNLSKVQVNGKITTSENGDSGPHLCALDPSSLTSFQRYTVLSLRQIALFFFSFITSKEKSEEASGDLSKAAFIVQMRKRKPRKTEEYSQDPLTINRTRNRNSSFLPFFSTEFSSCSRLAMQGHRVSVPHSSQISQ